MVVCGATPGMGMVTPGRISTLRVVISGGVGSSGVVRSVVVGVCVVVLGGAGAEYAGTPACPAIGSGVGNFSTSVPWRAPSIVSFQMSDGRPDP